MINTICQVFTEGRIDLPYKNISRESIINTVEAVLSSLKKTEITVSVIITDNECIQKINNDFRDKNYATDVISFPADESFFPEPGELTADPGEIYISLEKAEEQYEQYSDSLEDEMKRLLIHGTLHLLGYDHERSDEDEQHMEKLELELMRTV